MRILKYVLVILVGIATLPLGANSSRSNFAAVSSLIIDACAKYNFDPEWAFIIFNDESYHLRNVSTCEPKYIKKYGKCIRAYGVPQILYKTAIAPEVCSVAQKTGVAFFGQEEELLKNEVSIPLGVIYLAHLKKIYKGNMEKVLSHYKSGSTTYAAPYAKLYPKYQAFSAYNTAYRKARLKSKK